MTRPRSAPVAWVVGHGLLGRSVVRAHASLPIPPTMFSPDEPVEWELPERASGTLDRNLEAFFDFAERSETAWRLMWCAGAGVVATEPDALRQETATFTAFLQRAATSLERRPGLAARGTVFLASSAGGVYAASPSGPPFNESSPVDAMSAYGDEKLAQERAVSAVGRLMGAAVLIGRVSNLYGPGQDLGKPQGLIGHVGKCALLRRPVPIYVPLDTIRDYLYAADAGVMIAAACERLEGVARANPSPPPVVKIFASEVDTSVAAVLATWRRSLHRPLGVSIGSHPVGRLQPRTLSFRSEVWPDLRGTPKPLLEGIGMLLADQLRQLRAGTLAGAARP